MNVMMSRELLFLALSLCHNLRHTTILPSQQSVARTAFICAMAWVRPKNQPKRKQEPVDPTESLVPILNFFSGRRSSSPTKPKPKPLDSRAVSHDPILSSLQHAQANTQERPTTSHSHKTSEPQSQELDPHPREIAYVRENRCHPVLPRKMPRYESDSSPSPPPSPPRRPKLRITSYERPMPKAVMKARHTPRHQPFEHYEDEEPYWAVSSKFARAKAPLNCRCER